MAGKPVVQDDLVGVRPATEHQMPRLFAVRFLSVGLLALLSLAACTGSNLTKVGSPPYEHGSGKVVTESRDLGAFHGVSASEGVIVHVSRGSTAAAVVAADDNILGHVTTDVRDGTLLVGVEGSIETSSALDVTVTVASVLDSIVASSGATVDTQDLAASGLKADASSGATLRFGGRAETLDLTVGSGATADLRNVESPLARVRISTGSTAYVNASGSVTGSCDTGSTLHVRGGPATLDVATDVTCAIKRE